MTESPIGSQPIEARSLAELLATLARRFPNAPALVAPGRAALSYEALWTQVGAVVRTLRAHGVHRHDRVALLLPDGPESAVAVLAVATGATAAPFHPGTPAPELARALAALPARALVVAGGSETPAVARALPPDLSIIALIPRPDAPAGAFALEGAESESALTTPPDFAGAEDCALVLHTSGTTARPKRVPLTHANLCHSAHTIAAWLELTPADRCLNVMPLFHIHGLVGALLASLAAGASVVCPSGGFAAPRFFSWLAECRPTWYTAVPALHHAILSRAPGHRDLIARHPLRFVRSASAPLPSGLLGALEAALQAPVLEAYGMTEAAHQIASNPLPPRPRKPGSVGVPTGTDVVILDATGRPLPAGETGEITIRGAAVTAGYEDAAEPATVPTPVGWLRTGDLGFLDPEGYLFLTGRLKDLINRGGEKIAPREVEDTLLAHPAVAQAVAFPVPHPQLGEDVAAAVVLHAPEATTAPALRAFLASRLAPFKIPRQLLLVDTLPTSTTGKLSRSTLGRQLGLTAPAQEQILAASDPTPPRTPLEGSLAALWREVLGVNHVGPDDDFFALGGDSLLATQLAARARAALRLDLSLLQLFETPTLGGLAHALEAAPPRPDVPRPRPARRERTTPLSPSQERVWFMARFEPGSPVYHRPVTLRLRGTLDVDALGQSLGEIVRRHDVLRATFAAVDGRPVQAIAPPEPVPLRGVDLRDRPASGREAGARRWISEEIRRPFDLARGPLLRATLLRLDTEDHVLQLTVHHIVFDGWSETVVRRELAALYPAFAQGRPSPLPDLPLQYPDVTAWQEQALHNEALASDLGYWRQRLGGPLPVLQLPTDHPRSATGTHRGAHHAVTLSRGLTDALHVLSRRHGATLFMTLLAGFQTLLHRYTEQDDVLVGVPVAGRIDLETEALIGIFINTLVLRADLSGDPSFARHLAQVRERALEAYAHQALPFDRLVRALQPVRRSSQNPLFQVLFQLRNVPRESPPIPALSVEPFPVESGSAMFDLALDVTEQDGVLRCVFEYATDLFDPPTIERMSRHFQRLLEGAVAEPGQRLSRLPLLADAERRELLLTWNVTATPIRRDECLHQLVEAQVERTPHAVAVADDAGELTYRQLNRRANQLAHRLRKLGVGPDTPVAVCMERSTETVAALLAVLKAGGAYLPLEPTHPRERLAMMVEDARAPVLLTQERLASRLPVGGAAVISVDATRLELEAESHENPGTPVTADHLAYLIYTSGSTGTPKAVMVPHRAISNHLRWRHTAFPMDESDRFLQKAPLGFDISAWEIFAPLSAGARSILARPRGEMDPGYLVRVIAEQRITIAHFGPAMLQAFLEAEGVERCRGLRRVFCGGEPLTTAVAERFFARLGGELVHQYGPTEACVDSTFWVCRPGDRTHALPIGRPIANTRVYVLDHHLQPVPVGVPGELHIGGAGLARGYLGRPELTAERFIPDPFVDEPGARLYKTGDRARYRPDGNLEFLGRLDHQVKLRGFRIELGEIEAVLARHPAVREVVVALREDRPGDGRLVAYLVSREAPPPSVRELRSFLADTLPAYMVPAAFVPLAAMPRTSNGKVDRRTLPPPADPRPGPNGRFVAPRTPIEERLAAIWRESLGFAQVGRDDDFFELGGHSLLAAQIVTRIQSALGLDLPVRAMFDAPTVAGLATLLEQQAISRAEPGELDRIMMEVEQLSDDEVQVRLMDGMSDTRQPGDAR